MSARQIHVTNGTSVQTLAAHDAEDGGVTICSVIGGSEREIHIPAAARPWLRRVALVGRRAPVVPSTDAMREEAEASDA